MTFIKNFMAEENGADMVEYALLIGLVALGALVGVGGLGTQISTSFGTISNKLIDKVK